jgi:proteasome lid subunit RPN8/RPN11
VDQLEIVRVLRLSVIHWLTMLSDVCMKTPNEACGLAAGANGVVQKIYRISNEHHSPVRFRLDPAEQVAAFIDMEQHHWDLLAIYHSHPEGPLAPSETDLAEFYYPDALSLIWAREKKMWQCWAYEIKENQIRVVQIILTENVQPFL